MKKSTASASMQITAAVSLAAGIIFAVLNNFLPNGFFETLTITSCTVFYHFGVRLLIGGIMQAAFKNKMNYRKQWFQPKAFEAGLYKKLGVKKWKNKMPTYAPEAFSLEKHTVEEVLGASCQAEAVHTINVIASFVPLLFSLTAGAFPVFLITSLLAAVFDMVFVIIQRYNRPQLLRLIDRRI